jgi:hypothetical protein
LLRMASAAISVGNQSLCLIGFLDRWGVAKR